MTDILTIFQPSLPQEKEILAWNLLELLHGQVCLTYLTYFTLFEFVKNENFIKKCQKVCSIHSIRKVTFYCGCCIFLKYCQSVEEHSVCCYQDASTDTLFRVLFLDRPVDFSLMHFKYTPRYVTVWNIDCVMKQIKLK